MANREEITITITPEGETEVSVAGVKGVGCRALTEALERELGAVISDTPTREMTEREVRHVEQHRSRY